MQSLAVPTTLQHCGVRANSCRGVAAGHQRHTALNRGAHVAPALARNGACTPVCAEMTMKPSNKVDPKQAVTAIRSWWHHAVQAMCTRIAAAMVAAAGILLAPSAALAAASSPPLLNQLASRAQVLLGALLAAEPSNYALGMTGALFMMLITGMTLRRMDAPPTPAVAGPALPSPTRSTTFASGATAFLGPAIAATPRPTIRDILKSRPPRRRTPTGSTPTATPPPAVLASALAAANAPTTTSTTSTTSSMAAAQTNTVDALKNARAARAAGLQRAVVQHSPVVVAQSSMGDGGVEVDERQGMVVAQPPASPPAMTQQTQQQATQQHSATAYTNQPSQHQEEQPPSGNIFTRMFHKQPQHGSGLGDVAGDVEAAAAEVLSSMGLQPEVTGVRSRFDVWQAFLGISAPTVRSKYDPWTYIRAATAPTGHAELDVFKVIVTVQPPQGRAAFDPLAALGSWAAPTSTPGFDPVRALLGVSPPAGQPLFSLFRGLAEAEPQAGVGTEAWDVVGALLQAGAPVAKSKYDIMQGLKDVQAPTTVSKYDISTELKNAKAPTGKAFNMIKDLVATLSKASSNKQVDRDSPLDVVGLGSATKADGTKVDVYGVTMKKAT